MCVISFLVPNKLKLKRSKKDKDVAIIEEGGEDKNVPENEIVVEG